MLAWIGFSGYCSDEVLEYFFASASFSSAEFRGGDRRAVKNFQ
jgi:hypothetical protein